MIEPQGRDSFLERDTRHLFLYQIGSEAFVSISTRAFRLSVDGVFACPTLDFPPVSPHPPLILSPTTATSIGASFPPPGREGLSKHPFTLQTNYLSVSFSPDKSASSSFVSPPSHFNQTSQALARWRRGDGERMPADTRDGGGRDVL